LNEKLEQRVIDRTRALAAANERLEAEIAHRVRTEERLRQREAQLAEGQRLTRTGSWTWNTATGRLRWSEEHFRIFGFDPARGEPSYEEAIARVHPEDRPAFDHTLAQAVAAQADSASASASFCPTARSGGWRASAARAPSTPPSRSMSGR
jgi:PAS domain-containing protein